MEPIYMSIQQKETGNRIRALLKKNGYTVRDIQGAMGFENPQAIYKWLSGKTLPSLDNLLILSRVLHTTMEDILVIDGDIFCMIGNCVLSYKNAPQICIMHIAEVAVRCLSVYCVLRVHRSGVC